jgi:hypothetical protein
LDPGLTGGHAFARLARHETGEEATLMKFPTWFAAVLGGLALIGAATPSRADKIKHPTAVFAGLDKITGRIISFEVAIDETVQFGSLQITPRVCFSRPATEAPRTDAFAEVDEVETDKTLRRIFTGWMFADSPGLHGIEHPVYDIWLTECKGDGPLIKEAPETAAAAADDDPDSSDNPHAKPATPGAAATPKPVKTKRAKKANAAAGPGDAPADAGQRTPSRQFFPDDASAPGAPMRLGR